MKTYTRTLLLFLLSAAAIFPASAQWSFGIQGGYTYSTLTTKTRYFYDWNYVGRGGYAIGFPVQYEFFDWLAVQAELSWIQKNYRLERSPYYGFYENRTNYYLSVPVFARFSFGGRKIRGFLNAGGYAGGWLASQRQGIEFTQFGTNQGAGTGSVYYQYDENYEFDKRRDNRFEGGLLLGIGIEYRIENRMSVYIEGRYYHSLSDMQKKYMKDQAPRYLGTFLIQAGYILSLPLSPRPQAGKARL